MYSYIDISTDSDDEIATHDNENLKTMKDDFKEIEVELDKLKFNEIEQSFSRSFGEKLDCVEENMQT